MTTPELDAIRGHSSAASFATGPVMADPFISPLGLTICVLSVVVHVSPFAKHLRLSNFQTFTHHTSVVLEVQEDTVCSPPWLALADNDGGHDLLPQLRLSLLDGSHDHVSSTTGRQTVKTRTNTLDGDDVQVTGARVVAAVHDGSAVLPLAKIPTLSIIDSMRERRFGEAIAFRKNVHRQTEGHLELVTGGRTSTADMLVNALDVIASTAFKWVVNWVVHTHAWMPLRLIIGVVIS
jgi:hypothetical protein